MSFRKTVFHLFVLAVLSTFAGCGGNSSSNDIRQNDEEKNPNDIIAVEGDFDNNGILDNVHEYITDVADSTEQKEALEEYARALQTAYYKVTTPEEASLADQEIIMRLCRVISSDESSDMEDISRMIEVKMSNTPERLAKQMEYEDLLGGKTFGIPSQNNVQQGSFSAVEQPDPSILVAYINGINSPKSRVRHDVTVALSSVIDPSYKEKTIKLIMAYNPTRGLMLDLADVFRQKISEYPGVASELILQHLVSNTLNQAIPLGLRKAIADYHIEKMAESEETGYDDEDLDDIVQDILNDWDGTQKILLVAHSEGVLYAVAVFNRLTGGANPLIPASSIRIYAIGGASAYLPDNNLHTTSYNDLVIKNLQDVLGFAVLSPNFMISIHELDMMGHSLSKTYLNPELEGRAEVIRCIHASLDSLLSSEETGGISTGGWGEVRP